MTAQHAITIDEISEHPREAPRDFGFAAFCECGWRGDWHHSDAQASWPNDQAHADAEQDATDEGDEHLAEHAEYCACGAPLTDNPTGGLRCADGCPPPADDTPNIPAFLALAIPTTDEHGHAL